MCFFFFFSPHPSKTPGFWLFSPVVGVLLLICGFPADRMWQWQWLGGSGRVGFAGLALGTCFIYLYIFRKHSSYFPIKICTFRIKLIKIHTFLLKTHTFPIKKHTFTIKIGPFPIKIGPFPIKIGPFPIKIGPFPIKIGPFPIKIGPFPIKNAPQKAPWSVPFPGPAASPATPPCSGRRPRSCARSAGRRAENGRSWQGVTTGWHRRCINEQNLKLRSEWCKNCGKWLKIERVSIVFREMTDFGIADSAIFKKRESMVDRGYNWVAQALYQ
jgi:hypothetical protein